MRFALALAALCLPFSALAQPESLTIRPGDGVVDGRRITPYDNVWRVQLRYPDGRVVDRGLSTDHVSTHEASGRVYLTRIETTSMAADAAPGELLPRGGTSTTYNVFDPETMLPAYGESRGISGGTLRETFKPSGVDVVTLDAAGVETTTHQNLNNPVYDFDGGMTGLILAAMPLREDFSALIPSFGDHGTVLRPIAVERRARIDAGRLGMIDAWIVRVGAPEEGTLYWITSHAPYVIRCEITRADGSVAIWATM